MDAARALILDREVGGSLHPVELMKVVGKDAAVEKRLAQLGEDLDPVIDAGEQDRLVEEQAASGGEIPAGSPHAPIELARMVGVEDHDPPQRQALEPGAELLVHPLREDHRHPGMDAQDAKIGQGGQRAGELLQFGGGQGKRIAAAQDQLPKPPLFPQPGERRSEALGGGCLLGVGEVAAEAVAAMDCAGAGRHEQGAPLVLHQDAGAATGVAIAHRVSHEALDLEQLEVEREDLAQQRVVGIAGTHLRRVAAWHAHREAMRRLGRKARGELGQAEKIEQRPGFGESLAPGALPIARAERPTGEVQLRVIIAHLAGAPRLAGKSAAILAPASEPPPLRFERKVMASYGLNDVRNGLKILIDGEPYTILDCDFIKPGKGQAFTRIKIRNLKNGRVTERTLKATDTVEGADVVDTDMQYLYFDGEYYHFMHPETYEQVQADRTAMGEAAQWLKGEETCIVTLWNGQPLTVTPPNFVELAIVETDPGVRGDTASGGGKPAKLETGAVVRVPLFVNQGEVIRIDTRTGEYVARVK